MIKKITFLLLLIAFSVSTFAQKAKTRRIAFSVMHLPTNPLSASTNTYSVLVNNTSTEVKVSAAKENSFLNLRGFKKTEIGNADVRIKFTINAVKTSSEIKSKEEKKKVNDKEVKVLKYYYEINSRTISRFTIQYKSGKQIKVINFNGGGDYMYIKKSSHYDSRAAAQKAYNDNKKKLLYSAKNGGLDKVLSTIKTYLDNNHAYYPSTEIKQISTGKGKKHDYTNLDATFESFKAAAKLISPNNVPEITKTEFLKCIETWKETIGEYEKGNKKARISDKNIVHFHLNIAAAYLYLNEFGKAREWTNKAISLAKRPTTSKTMLKTIDKKENLHNLNVQRELERAKIINNGTALQEKVVEEDTEEGVNKIVKKEIPKKKIVLKEEVFQVEAMKGISPDFRVKLIKKVRYGTIRLISYHYNGNKLAYTLSTIKGLKIDSTSYTYESTRVTAQTFDYSNAEGKWYLEASSAENSVFYQVHNGVVVSKIDGDQKINYFYEKGKLTSVEISTFALGALKSLFRYSFVHANKKIEAIQVARKIAGNWNKYENSTLTFNHSNFTVSNKINGMVFELDYRNGPLSRIQKYEKKDYDNPVYEYRRSLDANKCIDNELVLLKDGKKVEYEVAYEKAKGNEKLFLGSQNWEINTFFNQISIFSEKDLK